MAEAVSRRRKKKKQTACSEEEQVQDDLSEGIPDVSDLNHLLSDNGKTSDKSPETGKVDTEPDKEFTDLPDETTTTNDEMQTADHDAFPDKESTAVEQTAEKKACHSDVSKEEVDSDASDTRNDEMETEQVVTNVVIVDQCCDRETKDGISETDTVVKGKGNELQETDISEEGEEKINAEGSGDVAAEGISEDSNIEPSTAKDLVNSETVSSVTDNPASEIDNQMEDMAMRYATLKVNEEAGDVVGDTAEKLYPDLTEQLQKLAEQEQQAQNEVAETESKLEESNTKSTESNTHDTDEAENMDTIETPTSGLRQSETCSEATLASNVTNDTVKEVIDPAPDERVTAFAPPMEDVCRNAEREVTSVVEKRQVMDDFQPLAQEQLKSLYYNRTLENNAAYIDKFIQMEMKRENHEFYEILMSYQRARKQLLLCEAAVKTYEEDYRKNQSDVWITETCTSTAKGTCGDGYNCTGTHTFNKSQLDYNALSRMTLAIKNIQEQIQNELSLHSYTAQLSKLQVESYIHDIFAHSPELRNIPQNLPVQACERRAQNTSHQVRKLIDCISILFVFHRLPIDDEEMLTNLQIWTERMISALLRVGTFEDHLFVLNHIMRCPSGIGSWAAHFVQVPAIPNNEDSPQPIFGNAHLDHVITALSTVLIPTSYRSEFMCQMQKMLQTGRDNKNLSWVMVDSDGEEDEDAQNAWMYLHENDIVAVLKQLSLATIFRHVLFVRETQVKDTYEYDIRRTSSGCMYRLFAFSTCMIGICGGGLSTYNMSRYRQLNKRLGRTIRQCVQLVTDHWESFRKANQGILPVVEINKLQTEYDAFFLRAVNLIHRSQRLGSWQYIADMPFEIISKASMWKILWLLHQGQVEQQNLYDISFIPSADKCMQFVKDPSCRSQLSDILQRVAASEGIYLLNTMTNMAQCSPSNDVSFIETVTMALFEVSFICPETRDTCCKMGRELLAEVVTCHPFLLSIITQRVNEYMEKLGQMGLYLFKGLPMETWLPADSDLVIIRQWLLNCKLGSSEHQIAQQILSSINWGTSYKGDRLMVPWRVHKHVSVLVVEAYQRFIHGKHLGSMIMEGVKQVSAAVQQSTTYEQELNSWCWSLLLKLALHRASLPAEDARAMSGMDDVPDVNKDDSLMPLYKGIKEKNPTACFAALLLTKYGHSLVEYVSDGIALLEVLTEQGLFKATINVIYYTCLMFVDNQKYLLDSVRFQEVLLSVLRADESYFKVVKGLLSYDFPGPITKLFTSMILSCVETCGKQSEEKMVAAINIWTLLMLSLPRWHQDRNICCVLDHLIKAAYTNDAARHSITGIFSEQYKTFCQAEKNQGVMSSLMNWVTSGVTLPTYLDKSSCGEFSWLAYVMLCLEGDYEFETKLWPSIQEELLYHVKAGTEQCLKKSISKLKLEQAPTWGRLSILRFAQQALDMPKDHPAAVLTWQRFFVTFLGRLNVTKTSLPMRASVGERFFTSLGYSSMPKKMKKRLAETADYYLKLARETNADGSENNTEDDVADRKEMYNKLARLYQTFELWVEEPLLHDACLYLPSLPPQYQADKLLKVFQNITVPWMEYIDLKAVSQSLVSMVTEWRQDSTPCHNSKSKQPKETSRNSQTSEERILERLSRCDDPLPPPPLHPVNAPVPEIDVSIMENHSAILHLLDADFTMIRDQAGRHCFEMLKLKSLDDNYIDLVPQLYNNVKQQVTIQMKCSSMINPLHKCTKPGAVSIWIDEKTSEPIKQRQADENRAEYKQRLIECRMPLSKNSIIASVHAENAITMLVKLSRACTDDGRKQKLSHIACSLFFRLGEVITDSVLQYPPTQQFFASCIDILGKEFIQSDGQQTEKVLHLTLDRLELGGMLAAHYKPSLAPGSFVKMYGRLVEQMKSASGGDAGVHGTHSWNSLQVVSMLLSKFDVMGWLTGYNPSKQEVQTFVDHLGQAFIACDSTPQNGYLTIFQLYLSHEKRLLEFRFPLNLHVVLATILQGSSAQRVSTDCWEVLLGKCFHGNQCDGQGQMYTDVSTALSLEEIRNLLVWLGQEFMQMRLSTKQSVDFALYPKWRMYTPCIAKLIRDLCKCLIDKMLPNLAEASTNEGLDMIWRTVVDAFAPWIQTLTVQKVAAQPWIHADRDVATHMVQALTHVVAYGQHKTIEIQHRFFNNFLSLHWLYFATVLCKDDVSTDVVSLYNLEFAKLPWQGLVPNMHVLETMTGLREYGCSLGFNLVADVMSLINWGQVSSFYESRCDHAGLVKYEGCLFLLLIQAFSENKHIENPDIEQHLKQAITYKWKHMSSDDFRKACSWLMQSCDPKCLMKGRTAPEVLGIRLTESGAGFNTEVSMQLTESWTSKRLSYLHCLTSLICQCTYAAEVDANAISTVIINLLTEVETVQSAVPDTHIQREESTDMMKELLSLLNNSNPDNQGSNTIMAAIIDWLQGSPQTILLSPCIHAATRNLASLTHMAHIVEQCIQLSFIPGGQRPAVSDPWASILAAIQIPELNLTEFFAACLQESSFLLLHSYILQHIPLCQSLLAEQGIIDLIMDWSDAAKPSLENESKLLLWWYKALELILRQLDFGQDKKTCVTLLQRFLGKLKSYGEDRASVGLLGAIGLGKKSQLSEKFRVCSRALVAFCSNQILSENRLRLTAQDPASSLTTAKQDTQHLLSIKSNKKYQPIKMEMESTCDFVIDQSQCFRDVLQLLVVLKDSFYPGVDYLCVIKSSE